MSSSSADEVALLSSVDKLALRATISLCLFCNVLLLLSCPVKTVQMLLKVLKNFSKMMVNSSGLRRRLFNSSLSEPKKPASVKVPVMNFNVSRINVFCCSFPRASS